MKVLKKDYKHGFIEVIPENSDDLYSIYRILKPGDLIKTITTRRIRRNNEEGRADTGERVKMTLEISVESFAFHGYGDTLRVKGKIVSGPENLVSLGTYHTLVLQPMEKVKITKKVWTSTEIKVIEDAEKASMLAQILIIIIDDDDVHISLITQFSIKTITEYRSGITRKFSDIKQYTTEMGKFFTDVLQVIEDANKQYQPKVIILAGPGFIPEDFYDFIKKRNSELTKKIQLIHVSTGGRVGLSEVLSKKLPEKIAEEQRVAYEMRLLDEVFKRIGKQTGTVTYGLNNVKKAIEFGAVDTLLISDDMLKLDDLERREIIDKLVEENEKMRGKTVIMSVLHESGQQLSTLGGIAALLRYPLLE